jgi:hypothetical protein
MGGQHFGRKRLMAVVTSIGVIASLSVIATQSEAGAAPQTVRLHLGSDYKAFVSGSTTQTLTTARNSCAINSAEPLIDLSSTGNQSSPGLVVDGIGVKGTPSSGNGSPCSQTDATESLTLRPGSELAGRTFNSVRLDLEMTGNAVVVLTLSSSVTAANTRTYRLQTGTSISSAQSSEADYDLAPPYDVSSTGTEVLDACAAPNSSGPNSAGNDNCRWQVTPNFNFDTVRITTDLGTVALEGGGDFSNAADFETVFFLSNAAPIAVTDSVTTDEDTPITFDVLANDSDGDGQTLSVAGTTAPTRGTLAPGATSGTFTYTPNLDVSGSDSFTYTITDGTDSATATVNISVTAVNDRPVALNPNVSTDEDTAVVIPVATDVDSTVLDAVCTGVTGGTVTNLGNGSIRYVPAANVNGSVTFTCTVTDDRGASTTVPATVNVGVNAVNDPPVAGDDSAEVNENTTLTPSSVTIDVVANDTDVDAGAVLTVQSASGAAHGTLTFSGGTVTYVPDLHYVGADSFTYTVTDGQATDTATVGITVFQVICSGDTVTDSDGAIAGTFERLTDDQVCKRYVLEADAAEGTVLFTPDGAAQVDYRGFLTFDPQPAPSGTLSLLLEYDPTGGFSFQPVQWCIDPQFDGVGAVVSATLPGTETWCIASETTRGAAGGQVVTTWQVFGHDDPRFQ